MITPTLHYSASPPSPLFRCRCFENHTANLHDRVVRFLFSLHAGGRFIMPKNFYECACLHLRDGDHRDDLWRFYKLRGAGGETLADSFLKFVYPPLSYTLSSLMRSAPSPGVSSTLSRRYRSAASCPSSSRSPTRVQK